MSWFFLVIAGLFEMTGVIMINHWHQTKNIPSMLGVLTGFGLSFLFLSLAMEDLPMGTAYAVWTGIGASGGALMGMIFFNESADWRRICCITLIIGSAIGLKLL